MLGACSGVLTRLFVGPALYGWPEAIFFWVFVAAIMRLPEIARQEKGSEPELGQTRQTGVRLSHLKAHKR